MTPAAIINHLAAQGLHLTRKGGSIVITPRQAATPEVIDLVRANKPDLLAVLPDATEGPALMSDERQRLITQAVGMLRDRPDDTRAVVGVPQADGRCLVAVALRNADGSIGTALLDALIDPFELLDLVERHGATIN